MTGKYIPREAMSQRRRSYKKEARAVLCFRSNWLSVLMVLFLLLFFVVAAQYFSDCFFYALTLSGLSNEDLALIDGVFSAVSALLVFLLLSPLYPGIVSYMYDLCRSEKTGGSRVPITEIFCYYSGIEHVVRGWTITVLRLLALAPMLLLYAGYLLLDAYVAPFLVQLQPQTGTILAEILLWGAGFLFLLLTMCVSLRAQFFVFGMVTRPELPTVSCIRYAGVMLRKHAAEGLLLMLSFFPLCILSVLSGGILFFLYLLPYYCFTVLCFCTSVSTEADA